MRKSVQFTLAAVLAGGLVVPIGGSSHREAPLISEDPLADNTDVYAFVSPDAARHGDADRQLDPARGAGRRPELLQVRRRRPLPDQHRQQRRRGRRHRLRVPVQDRRSGTRTRSCTTPARSRRSTTRTSTSGRPTRSTRIDDGRAHACSASDLPTPPVNIGPRSTPNYDALGGGGRHTLPTARRCSPVQRDDPFFVDLGSVSTCSGCVRSIRRTLIPLPDATRASTASGLQRAQHRPAGAEVAADARRQRRTRPEEHELDHRRLLDDLPPAACGSCDRR